MEYAARSGQLAVVQWLFDNRPEVRTVKAMECAAREGHADVVEWLHKRTDSVCSDRILEDAAREGHLNMVRWLEENTTQRAAGWGLVEASQRGCLEVLLVWFERRYDNESSMGTWERGVMQKCCNKTLSQLIEAGYSFMLASGCDDTTCDLIKTLNRYHSEGFRKCANVMLQSALEVGYIALVQRFFKKRNDLELEKNVEITAESGQLPLLRWLLENGARLTVNTANLLMTRGAPVEVTWWLSETDRVVIVCKALRQDSSELPLWLLENTTFLQTSSRESVSNAIETASDGIRHLLLSTGADSLFLTATS